MNKPIIAAIVAVFFAMPGYALAQSTPRIDKRQERQDDRIERGIETGELTKKETRRLDKGQEHIDDLEDKALDDGKVTKREQKRINKAQDKQGQRIYNQRHDQQGK
jgi:hypothetical protein